MTTEQSTVGLEQRLRTELAETAARGLTRRRMLESPCGRTVTVDGKNLLNFASNDYLGPAGNSNKRGQLRFSSKKKRYTPNQNISISRPEPCFHPKTSQNRPLRSTAIRPQKFAGFIHDHATPLHQ